MSYLVSVIVPVYNGEQTLKEALDSVIAQSFRSFEIIVVDDGSTDSTCAIVEEYSARHRDIIKLLKNTKNMGVAYSRNSALRIARGDFIAFLDADDSWENSKLAKQIGIFDSSSTKLGMVHTAIETIYEEQLKRSLIEKGMFLNDTDVFSQTINSVSAEVTKQGGYLNMLELYSPICFSSCMFRKQVFDQIGFFDESLGYQVEDRVLWLKVAYYFDIHFIEERLTKYRIHESCYTYTSSANKEYNISLVNFQILDRFFEFLQKKGESYSYKNLYKGLYFTTRIRLWIEKRQELIRNQRKKILFKLKRKFQTKWRENRKEEGLKSCGLLILFVTNKCNLNCEFCFLDKNIDDLDLATVDKMLNGMDFASVALTGGEPFLNKNIAIIAEKILKRTHLEINTNGFLCNEIDKSIRYILERSSGANALTVNVSLDGFSDTHNDIRKNNLSYIKALDTLRVLLELKKEYPFLKVGVNTVLCERNYKTVLDFAKYIATAMTLDFHSIEFDRFSQDFPVLLRKESLFFDKYVDEIVAFLVRTYPEHGRANKKRILKQKKILLNNEPWGYYCGVFSDVVVVYPDGRMPVCEMRSEQINLKNYDWNIRNALETDFVSDMQNKIKKEKCFCLHGCWLLPALNRRK